MTFLTEEAGHHAVLALFEFARDGAVYRYTDAPADVVVSGLTYRAGAVRRDGWQRTNEDPGGELVVVLPRASAFGTLLATDGIGRRPIAARVREVHAASVGGVGASPSAPAVRFSGRVADVTRNGETVTLRCESLLASLKRPLLRVITSASCNNVVYDAQCTVDPAAFRTEGTVTALAGATLTVAEAADQADGYYAAGLVLLGTGATQRPFHVEAHEGETLTLLEAPPATIGGVAVVGSACALLAGCPGDEATCASRFDNRRNFRGFPRVPSANPFASGGWPGGA